MHDDTAQPTASLDDPPADPAARRASTALSIELCDGFVAALRVLVALRGRGCAVERVTFSGEDLRLDVELDVPAGREHSLRHRLANMVGVRAVADASTRVGSRRTG